MLNFLQCSLLLIATSWWKANSKTDLRYVSSVGESWLELAHYPIHFWDLLLVLHFRVRYLSFLIS